VCDCRDVGWIGYLAVRLPSGHSRPPTTASSHLSGDTYLSVMERIKSHMCLATNSRRSSSSRCVVGRLMRPGPSSTRLGSTCAMLQKCTTPVSISKSTRVRGTPSSQRMTGIDPLQDFVLLCKRDRRGCVPTTRNRCRSPLKWTPY